MLSDRWAQSPTRQSGNSKERQQQQQHPVIGLGLGMRFEGTRRSKEEESEDNIRVRRKDERSYADDHNTRGYPTPIERSGRPTYHADDHSNDDHRKRNAALMGIVNDLDLEQGFEPRMGEREMEGNYQNQFVSAEIGMAYGNHIMDPEYDEASVYGSESEEEPNQQFDAWREQSREEQTRPRSIQKTPMPTLVVSMEDGRRGGRRSSQVSPDPRLSANFSSPRFQSPLALASPRLDQRRSAAEADEKNKGKNLLPGLRLSVRLIFHQCLPFCKDSLLTSHLQVPIEVLNRNHNLSSLQHPILIVSIDGRTEAETLLESKIDLIMRASV